MEYKNIFENKEFDTKLNAVKDKISTYIIEKKIDLDELDIDSLIGWMICQCQEYCTQVKSVQMKLKILLQNLLKKNFQ